MSNRTLSYRGRLKDGGQDSILLSTKKGEVGYRIVKFQLMTQDPGTDTMEGACKIYKIEQSTIDGTVDFNDNRLLGAGEYHSNENTAYPSAVTGIIFDNEIFNQDIYITWKDNLTGVSINYYIELEQMKLSEDQAMVATLEDIRNND